MPATYSLDLRRRVVAAVDAGQGTQEEIAARFAVSLGWVEKLLRQRRRVGHIEPIGHRGGAPRRLDEPAVEAVRKGSARSTRHGPGGAAFAPAPSNTGAGERVQPVAAHPHLGPATQKKTFVAREADEDERRAFRAQMADVDTGTRRLIFLDETGCNLNMTRRYGRAPKGVRLVDRSVPRNTPVNRSLVGAMSREGLLTSMELEGAIDGDAFFVFLENFLGPCLRPGDVVLMDNLSTHKSARMAEAIRAQGAEVVFLPRYSPDFNPIEGAWSKLKAYLRKVAARTPKALDRALTRGLARITAANARGWFQHAGYKNAQPL